MEKNSELVSDVYELSDFLEKNTDNKDDRLNNMFKEMFDGRYGLVLTITKKGSNLIGAFENMGAEVLAGFRGKATFCSDKLLACRPEFTEILKTSVIGQEKPVCLFDDSVRHGRKLKEIIASINEICRENNLPKIKLETKTITKFVDFDYYGEDGFKARTANDNKYISLGEFESVNESCHEEMKTFAKKTLRSIYRYRSMYSVAAPKTYAAFESFDEFKKWASEKKMLKVDDEEITAFFEGLNIDVYDIFLEKEKYEKEYGEKLWGFIKNASFEVYAFKDADETGEKAAIGVARASISRLSVENVDIVIDKMCERYLRDDKERNIIKQCAPELKYELINYALSVLTASEINGSAFFYDTSEIDIHYGKASRTLLTAVCDAVKKSRETEREFFKEAFEPLDLSYDNDSLKGLRESYIKVFDSILSLGDNEERTIDKYCVYRSMIDKEMALMSAEDTSGKKDLLPDFYIKEVPVGFLVDYIKEKRGYADDVTPIRRESVYSQIKGKMTVSTRDVWLRCGRFVEKYAKVGEDSAQAKVYIEEDMSKIYKTAQSSIYGTLYNGVFMVANPRHYPKHYLKEIWKHMEDKAELLDYLSPKHLEILERLFIPKDEGNVEKVEMRLENDWEKQYDLNEKRPERFVFELLDKDGESRGKLVFKAFVWVEEDAGGNVKKYVEMIESDYVNIYDNDTENCEREFDAWMRERFFDGFYDKIKSVK